MIVVKNDMKEMPKGCAPLHKKKCPFFKRYEIVRQANGYFSVCKADRSVGYKIITDLESRPDWCPLIEMEEKSR